MTWQEVCEKIGLYFEQGAHEVWVCDSLGKIAFETSQGPAAASGLAPDFPSQV